MKSLRYPRGKPEVVNRKHAKKTDKRTNTTQKLRMNNANSTKIRIELRYNGGVISQYLHVLLSRWVGGWVGVSVWGRGGVWVLCVCVCLYISVYVIWSFGLSERLSFLSWTLRVFILRLFSYSMLYNHNAIIRHTKIHTKVLILGKRC